MAAPTATVYHAHTSDLTSPGRFLDTALVVDCRHGRAIDPGWSPAVVAGLFPGRYRHIPGFGCTTCTSGDAVHTPQLIAWSEGLDVLKVQPLIWPPARDIICLCQCFRSVAIYHRQFVVRKLAEALGIANGGPLP